MKKIVSYGRRPTMVLKYKLREFVYKHELLKYWLMMIGRSGDKKWRRDVVHVWNSPDHVISECRGKKNRGAVLCEINCSGATGFMNTVLNVLYCLLYADNYNMEPIVLADNELYMEDIPVNGQSHFWEYYFKPCSKYSLEDLKDSFCVVPYYGKDFSSWAKNRWRQNEAKLYRTSDLAISDLARVYAKYVHLNDEMKTKIDYDVKKLLGNKKTLGVQIRRGDMLTNCDNHPVVPEISDFIEQTDKVLKRGDYDQVFLASSDKEVVKEYKKKYGDKMVAYMDIVRTEGVQGVWEADDKRKNKKYMSGVDVLRDVYTLVACASFIGCLSNVSLMARIIRNASGNKYECLCIVDKGMNHNNKRAEYLLKEQLKHIRK